MTASCGRRLDSFVMFAAATLGLSACTEAALFRGDGASASGDRLTVTGQVCAEDTLNTDLPVRLVVVGDYAAGPLFAGYDPGGERIELLNAFVQSALNRPNTEVAVVGYAGRPKKLAPMEGNFTTNPGELPAGINQLSIAQSCLAGGQCRDYVEGLRTARSLIEGDLAASPAGTRVLTQYVVLLVIAGPQTPIATTRDCCELDDAACLDAEPMPSPACQSQRELEEVTAMLDGVARAGALGLKLHVLHLAAEPDGAVNDQLEMSLKELAFAGSGSYRRVNNIRAITADDVDVLSFRTPLRVKTLFVANVNARITPTEPAVDSDADGISDLEEDAAGTSPYYVDSEGDGISDLIEKLVDFDPLMVDEPTACQGLEAGKDSDLDGLSDCDEALIGTEHTLVDSDGDGAPDQLEVYGFVDYLNRDAEADADGDGVSNADELRQRTDPRSTDAKAQLNFGYRYELEDLGVSRELYALPFEELTGVEFQRASDGTTPGVGTLLYSAADQTLRWQDVSDANPGPPVLVAEAASGPIQLASSTFAPIQGDSGRFIEVMVRPEDLPPSDIREPVRIIFRERQCLNYTVRNIRLMDTQALDDGTPAGNNRIVLFFSETPEGLLARPGPFRIAEVPVIFRPPNHREPKAGILTVLDEEFVRIQ